MIKLYVKLNVYNLTSLHSNQEKAVKYAYYGNLEERPGPALY